MAAISFTNLTSGGLINSQSSLATSSISPASNKACFATVSSLQNVGSTTPTLTGCGLTWVQVGTYQISQIRITMFIGIGTASTGALTFDWGGDNQTSFVWTVDQADNAATTGLTSVIQNASANINGAISSPITITLAAFANSNNAAYGVFCSFTNVTSITAGSGFTELSNNIVSGGLVAEEAEWKLNDNTVDWALGGAGATQALAMAIELSVPAGGHVLTTNSKYW